MTSSIVTSSLKPLAMADSSSSTLFYLPSIFNISSLKPRRSNFSFSTPRPINLPLSLKSTTHHNLSPVVTFVAQTSDWAEEEGDDGSVGGASVAVEENEESLEPEAKLWDGEGETSGTEEDGGEFPEPPEEAKLFVGNLPYDVDSQALAMLFEQAGTVEISEVLSVV